MVLAADDEPIIGATLVEILQEEGYDAICVSDGESALFWAQQTRPDYLVTDIVMPKLNGIELAKTDPGIASGNEINRTFRTGWFQRIDRQSTSRGTAM